MPYPICIEVIWMTGLVTHIWYDVIKFLLGTNVTCLMLWRFFVENI
jgi:hypothetical protein